MTYLLHSWQLDSHRRHRRASLRAQVACAFFFLHKCPFASCRDVCVRAVTVAPDSRGILNLAHLLSERKHSTSPIAHPVLVIICVVCASNAQCPNPHPSKCVPSASLYDVSALAVARTTSATNRCGACACITITAKVCMVFARLVPVLGVVLFVIVLSKVPVFDQKTTCAPPARRSKCLLAWQLQQLPLLNNWTVFGRRRIH